MAIFALDEQRAIYAQVFRTNGCLITLTDEHFNNSNSSSSSSNIETKANHIDEDPKPDRCDDIELGMIPPTTPISQPVILTRNDAGGSGCIICLEEFQPGETIVVAEDRACPHRYHKKCMITYFTRRTRTPNKTPTMSTTPTINTTTTTSTTTNEDDTYNNEDTASSNVTDTGASTDTGDAAAVPFASSSSEQAANIDGSRYRDTTTITTSSSRESASTRLTSSWSSFQCRATSTSIEENPCPICRRLFCTITQHDLAAWCRRVDRCENP